MALANRGHRPPLQCERINHSTICQQSDLPQTSSADYGLCKRKKRACWSSGTTTSQRPLLVATVSVAGCQFVEMTLVVDSRTYPVVDGNSQEMVPTELLRATESPTPAEPQVFNSTETLLDALLATAKSGLPSPLKSPTATETES